MNIVIFGAHSGYNKGDLGILISLVDNLSVYFKDSNFFIGSKNPSEIKRFIDKENVFISKDYFSYFGQKTFENLKKADLIIIGGGGLFFSRKIFNLGYNHILNLYLVTLFNKLFFKKPIYIIGVGSSHLDSLIAKSMTRFILKNSDFICVRDNNTKKEFTFLTDKKINLFYDLAFLLKPKTNRALKDFFRKNFTTESKKIIFCINDAIFSNGERSRHNLISLKKLLINLSQKYQVYLFQNDNKYNILYKLKSQKINIIPFNNLSPQEIIYLISFFDYSISSPMHFSIFSYLAKVETILVRYDDKVAEFAKITNNNFLVDVNNLQDIENVLEGFKQTKNNTKIDSRILVSARENFIRLVEKYNEK